MIMKSRELLIFDVNETLLDLKPVQESVGSVLEGRRELVPLWFTTMLHYSLVTTATGKYQDFVEIGVAALIMTAIKYDIILSQEEALAAIKPILNLSPHTDVIPALYTLKEAGFRMVTLTNSSKIGVATQIKYAGLTDFFEQLLSVEEIGIYKPHTQVYEWAAGKLNAAPENCTMVAAHSWDVAGAHRAGMKTAFIARPGQHLFPAFPTPGMVVPDFSKLTDKLLEL